MIDGVNIMWMRSEGEFSSLVGIEIEHKIVDPENFDEGLSENFITETGKVLQSRMPIMKDAPLRGGWSGVLTMSEDAHIILGEEKRVPGLYLAIGHSGTNFKTAPAIGACLAETMTAGKATTVDITAFRPTRFEEGQPIIGKHEYGEEGVTDVLALVDETADAVVIGGGILGTSTAFHLANAGVTNVALLERKFIGSGATGKSSRP